MKVVSHDDIVKLNIAPDLCYEWVDYMLLNKEKAILPAKISLKPQEGVFCNVMPSIIALQDGRKVGGIKVVTRYPSRIPSLDSKLLLFDADSGEFKAIVDANWITAMRTGAVATHSIILLGKKNFKRISIMGLGNTARATLLVLANRLKERDFTIKLLKYKGQEILFAQRFECFKNLHFEYVDSIEQLMADTDVVVSAATYLPEDVGADKVFPEGVLLVPIHTMGFTNCDLFFDKVYADDYQHVCHFKYFDKFKYFAEVSDVVNRKAEGRKNDKERILVYNIGIALHDLYFAANIFNLLDKTNLPDVNFFEPKEKFWI